MNPTKNVRSGPTKSVRLMEVSVKRELTVFSLLRSGYIHEQNISPLLKVVRNKKFKNFDH